MLTPFADLNEFIDDLTAQVTGILGVNLIGAYLHGSFATGAFDEHSDCDMLFVVRDPVSPEQRAALARMHEEIFRRDGHWNKHLECAYPPVDELRTLDGVGCSWLTVGDGGGDLEYSREHNNEVVRWEMHEHGVAIGGPPARSLVDAVGPDVVRARIRAHAHTFMPELLAWTSLDLSWTQRYAVSTMSRFLYDFHTGRIASKREALEWVAAHADRRWRPLMEQVLAGRALGWSDEESPTVPGGAERAVEFGVYVIATIEAGGLVGLVVRPDR